MFLLAFPTKAQCSVLGLHVWAEVGQLYSRYIGIYRQSIAGPLVIHARLNFHLINITSRVPTYASIEIVTNKFKRMRFRCNYRQLKNQGRI
ncbi:hypothetical protein BKA67DRAFT_549266 [Truncatella angustata]|uniref:Uncharacterized protein n=1 Tax=Truncatella angustata TaxID=152316 RepID=A0A9P9A3T7_9PEZI|nr:uncharacterized protein BKA67DRAFT_549266 [Truncatella angustata]KAH6660812.1 hypothetical protein BKA67DRAFT_549266 [Truncatella angustata]